MTGGTSLPFGYSLVSLDEVDSTNDEAKRLAAAGAADSTVVRAAVQTAGRGRLGRAWVSEAGNLFCSFVMRPHCAAAEAAQLTFVAAVAAAETIAEALPATARVTCKWPNDILVNGRKAAGILLESQVGTDGLLAWMVVGIGINVVGHPQETAYPATALRLEGAAEATADDLLQTLCAALSQWRRVWEAEGFEPLRRAWLDRAEGIGLPVRVRLPQTTLHGLFRAIDADGALVLDVDGKEKKVTAGDVFFESPSTDGVVLEYP